MFRTLAIVLYSAIALGFSACGNKPTDDNAIAINNKEEAITGQRNEVRKFNASAHTQFFNKSAVVKLNNVTFNFFPTQGQLPPDIVPSGKQYIRVEITITGDGETEPFEYNFTSFTLRLPGGAVSKGTYQINDSNSSDMVTQAVMLPKGKSMITALYYEAPTGLKASDMSLMVEGYDEQGGDASVEIPFK